MPSAARTRKRKADMAAQAKREKDNKTAKQLLGHARDEALRASVSLRGVQPVEAFMEVLESALSMMRYARAQANQVPPENMWRDTIAGKIPNEWVKLERNMREEVAHLSAQAMKHGLEERQTAVAERMAEALAIGIAGVLDHPDLRLTAAQRKVMPRVVKESLELMEVNPT